MESNKKLPYEKKLFLADYSLLYLNKREYKGYLRVKKVLGKLMKEKNLCYLKDVSRKLGGKSNYVTIRRYVFLLCTASEKQGERPVYAIRPKLPKNKPYYKIGKVIMPIEQARKIAEKHTHSGSHI